jgi:hypothetical protein
MDAEFTTQEDPFEFPAEGENSGAPANRVNLLPPKYVAPEQEEPFRTSHQETQSSHDMTDRDLVYMAMGMLTGEMPVGVIQMDYRLNMLEEGTKSLTDLQFVRSTARSVLVKEGTGLWSYLRWWSTISMVTLSVAYLSWAITAIIMSADSGWRSALETKSGVSILISLVAVCSLASLVQKLGSFGWRRSRRQLWAWLSPSRYKKRWRETDHMFGVYGTRNKAQSSVKWLVVFVTCIAWTGVSSMLPFLLG